VLREIEASGGRPYAIPAGASDHPLGGLGFANWAYELADGGLGVNALGGTISEAAWRIKPSWSSQRCRGSPAGTVLSGCRYRR
jgi:hypothetical protein